MAATQTLETIVSSLLHYDPDTGEMFWKPRTPDMFSSTTRRSAQHMSSNWNARYAGKPAFTCVGNHGYRQGRLMGENVLFHRVAFLLMTGTWPQHQVDHINGDRCDNRWENLRPATKVQNNRNKRKHGKTCKFIGVSWNKHLGGYIAKVSAGGVIHYCGFSTNNPEKLARKRDEKAKELFGEYARLNFEEN